MQKYLLLLILCVSSIQLFAVEFKGIVKDAYSSVPLQSIEINLFSQGELVASAQTDEFGRYSITIPKIKNYSIEANNSKYEPITTQVNGSQKGDVVIEHNFNLKKLHSLLYIRVQNELTGIGIEQLNVKVTDTMSERTLIDITNEDGNTFFETQPNTIYKVEVLKLEGLSNRQPIKVLYIKTAEQIESAFNLVIDVQQTLDESLKFKLSFDRGSTYMYNSHIELLDNIAKYLEYEPTLNIKIDAHTDAQNEFETSEELSIQRGEAVVKHLINLGVPNEKIIAIGWGAKQLLNNCTNETNCSDFDNSQNRRVEIELIE